MTVFESVKSLGEAIKESPEFKRVQETEAAVAANTEAEGLLAKFDQQKEELQSLMMQPLADKELIHSKTKEYQDTYKTLGENPLIHEMMEAQQGYSDLLKQVNQLLKFYVTGEMDQGCSTDGCASCAGCH